MIPEEYNILLLNQLPITFAVAEAWNIRVWVCEVKKIKGPGCCYKFLSA